MGPGHVTLHPSAGWLPFIILFPESTGVFHINMEINTVGDKMKRENILLHFLFEYSSESRVTEKQRIE